MSLYDRISLHNQARTPLNQKITRDKYRGLPSEQRWYLNRETGAIGYLTANNGNNSIVVFYPTNLMTTGIKGYYQAAQTSHAPNVATLLRPLKYEEVRSMCI